MINVIILFLFGEEPGLSSRPLDIYPTLGRLTPSHPRIPLSHIPTTVSGMLHHITVLSRGPLNAKRWYEKVLVIHTKSLKHIYDVSLTNHDPSMKYRRMNIIALDVI